MVSQVLENLKKELENDKTDPKPLMALWQEDGTFSSIDCDNDDRADWQKLNIIKFVRTMAIAAYSPGNPWYGDSRLREMINKSLTFWAGTTKNNPNWWFREIGIPLVLTDILVMGIEGLEPSVKEELFEEIKQGNIFDEMNDLPDRIHEREVKSTGANLTDKLIIRFKSAAVRGDEKEMYDIVRLYNNELRIFYRYRADEFAEDCEGIKADYSFHQHADQPQMGGYGTAFADDTAVFLNAVRGTGFMLSDEAVHHFENYLLDGLQWVFREKYWDMTMVGRAFSRQDHGDDIRISLRAAAEALLHYDNLHRREEIQQLYMRCCGPDMMEGHRHFWLSDYTVHKRKDFHVGVKISSNRTKPGEVINNENLLGYYLSDGVTVIMRHGDEYKNVLPLLDWNRLPGTTTPQGALKSLRDWKAWNGEHLWNWKGTCSFAGGIVYGGNGAVTMDYIRDHMEAQKSWFFFDGCMVCLGTGIGSHSGMELFTCINQCRKMGDVLVDGMLYENGPVAAGASVYHDGIAYIPHQDAVLACYHKIGKWQTINASNQKGTEEADVFCLGISHGMDPRNQNYAYRVYPGVSGEVAQALKEDSRFIILQNDDKIQAVYDTKHQMVQCVIRKAYPVTLPGGLTIETNKKCMLMVQTTPEGRLIIAASNPENAPKDLWVTVNREMAGEYESVTVQGGFTTVQFRLPEGAYAGSTRIFEEGKGFSPFLK